MIAYQQIINNVKARWFNITTYLQCKVMTQKYPSSFPYTLFFIVLSNGEKQLIELKGQKIYSAL